MKQKTAYELRISDWSSDVCSSDLERPCAVRRRPSCPDRFGGGQMTAIPACAVYAAAALAEIAGCFAVWAWMRPGASALWLLPCIVSLAAFAWALTLAPSDFAGRAYAAYGGVNIAASLVWLWAIEGRSEEHTSELQSLMRISYAVFCFKKKKHQLVTQ